MGERSGGSTTGPLTNRRHLHGRRATLFLSFSCVACSFCHLAFPPTHSSTQGSSSCISACTCLPRFNNRSMQEPTNAEKSKVKSGVGAGHSVMLIRARIRQPWNGKQYTQPVRSAPAREGNNTQRQSRGSLPTRGRWGWKRESRVLPTLGA